MRYSTFALSLAELKLEKPIGAIVAEANSEDGLSLHSLTTLYAALRYRGHEGMPLEIHIFQFDSAISTACKDVDERGAAEVGADVGKALGEYIESVLTERV